MTGTTKEATREISAKKSEKLTTKELKTRLEKQGLILDIENVKEILNLIDINNFTDDLLKDIVDYGKCEPCGMSKWFIYQKWEADNMKGHLICEGCDNKCEKGETDRHNDFFEFKDEGAYIFWENGKPVEKWYCKDCKFKFLCGDCGLPHKLEDDELYKSEHESFYTCFDCKVLNEEQHHQDNHIWEPSLDCWLCKNWAEAWETKKRELTEIK